MNQTTMNSKKGEWGITIGIASLALLFLIFSDFPKAKGASLGPAFFPRLTAGFALICCVWQMILMFRRHQKEEAILQTEESHVSSRLADRKKALYVAGTFLIMITYILLFEVVNYIILTVLFLVAVLFLIGVRRWTVILGIAVIYSVLSYFLFGHLLMVQLTW